MAAGSDELPAALARHAELDLWLQVNADETLTVRTGKVEIGQGLTTALALIAAHELDVPVSAVRVETAHTGRTPNEFITAGSMSIEDSGSALRQACAHARRLLLAAAADHLGEPAGRLEIADGWISVPGGNDAVSIWVLRGGRPFSYRIETRIEERPPAVPPPRQQRIDLPAKIRGAGVFLQDLRPPELLHARVIRPPSYHHRLVSIEAAGQPPESDLAVHVDGSFVAVTGEDEYAVNRFALRLQARCRWQQQAQLAGEPLGAHSEAFAVVDGTPVEGPVAPLGFAPTLTASYSRPHIMHASLAPSAAMARWDEGALRVWTHSQGPELLKRTLAQVLGVEHRDVEVVHAPGAGAYGHNGADDVALDAALCARARPGRPVLVKWTREQEHQWEPYGPAMRVDMAARLDAGGRIADWSHEVWSYTHLGRPLPGEAGSNLLAAWLLETPIAANVAKPRLGREVGIHRNAWPLYRLPAPRVVKRFVAPGPLRTSSLRSLGAHMNVFAIECFMDELAQLAGVDPVSFRRRHLSDPRALAVLEAAVALAGGLAGNRGVGLARYKNQQAYAAVVAQVAVDEHSATVRVSDLWIAADAGRVVDPDGLINQLEGGAVQSLSWTLKEAVRFSPDAVESRDWDTYPVLRFDEVPEVATRLIDRPESRSLGAGEATQGPAAAAVANAIAAATGLRVRDMPLDADALRRAAAR
ncbi:MAG: molybdopterin cofactor-binding domain-containing protein [Pseudomonadales bacterium]